MCDSGANVKDACTIELNHTNLRVLLYDELSLSEVQCEFFVNRASIRRTSHLVV